MLTMDLIRVLYRSGCDEKPAYNSRFCKTHGLGLATCATRFVRPDGSVEVPVVAPALAESLLVTDSQVEPVASVAAAAAQLPPAQTVRGVVVQPKVADKKLAPHRWHVRRVVSVQEATQQWTLEWVGFADITTEKASDVSADVKTSWYQGRPLWNTEQLAYMDRVYPTTKVTSAATRAAIAGALPRPPTALPPLHDPMETPAAIEPTAGNRRGKRGPPPMTYVGRWDSAVVRSCAPATVSF